MNIYYQYNDKKAKENKLVYHIVVTGQRCFDVCVCIYSLRIVSHY